MLAVPPQSRASWPPPLVSDEYAVLIALPASIGTALLQLRGDFLIPDLIEANLGCDLWNGIRSESEEVLEQILVSPFELRYSNLCLGLSFLNVSMSFIVLRIIFGQSKRGTKVSGLWVEGVP